MTEPLRIFYDARTIRPGMTGVGRATLALLAALAERDDLRIRALILNSAFTNPEYSFLPEIRGVEWVGTDSDYESHPLGDLALRFKIPKLVAPGEVYHGPAFAIPGGRQPFARVVTIHDVGVYLRPKFYPRSFAMYLRWVIGRSCAAADRIIVPSASVAADLPEALGYRPNRIDVVHEAPALPKPVSDADLPETCCSGDYAISIGTLEHRKDPLTVLGAIEKVPDLNFVWIGAPGHASASILEAIGRSPAAGRFRFLGPLGDAAAAAALARAKVFVAASRYEGFGLPLVEAMERGVPVIASDLPVFREIAGDDARFFPVGNSDALAALLAATARPSGPVRGARGLDWTASAQAAAGAYRKAAERHSRKS